MVMEGRVRKDLTLKIPKVVAKKLNLRLGAKMWIEKTDYGLILTPFTHAEVKEYKRKKRKHLNSFIRKE